MKNKIGIAFLAFLVFANCNPSAKIGQHQAPSIPAIFLGNFIDDQYVDYSISGREWFMHPDYKYHILKYDSAGQYFIVQNEEKNPFAPGLYTRIDVVQFNNKEPNSKEPWTWGFCLTVYKEKTFEAAEAAVAADRSDLKKGCGGDRFFLMKRNFLQVD